MEETSEVKIKKERAGAEVEGCDMKEEVGKEGRRGGGGREAGREDTKEEG